MTEEENNAIERLWCSITDVMFCCLYSQEKCDDDKRIVLDLIKKQQAELEKKDKMIDLMLELIKSTKIGISTEKGIECWNKEEWEKYFEKQVEKE